MIDHNLFNLKKLVATILDTHSGGNNKWWEKVEIVPDYMPKFPREGTQPKCVVKCGNSYLRHSKGAWQGYFWDLYGDDFLYPELALMAIIQAPVPPNMLKESMWKEDAQEKVV